MKSIALTLITLFSFTIFLSCEKISTEPEDSPEKSKGSLSFQFQKPENIQNVHYLAYYLTRDGFSSISDTLDVSSGTPQTVEVENVPTGNWTFKLDALDESKIPTYTGSVTVQILSGEITSAEVTMQPVSGSLIITVNWGGNAGNAIYLDGDGDYVSVPNTEKLQSLGSDFTLELWVLPVSQTYNTILAKGINTFMIEMVPGDFVGYYTKGLDVDLSNSWVSYGRLMLENQLSTKNWNHIAYTYSAQSGLIKLYYNGNFVHSAPATGSMEADTESIRIGSRPYPNDEYKLFFKGSIDEVRIWNIARTESQIKSSYQKELTGQEAGLVSYYSFNELIDGKFPDRSGNQNPGVIVGDVKMVKSYAF